MIYLAIVPKEPVTQDQMLRRSQETKSAHVDQRRSTKLVVEQSQGDPQSNFLLTKQLIPEREERKENKARREDLLIL
ncbi:hypothetical protein SLE2022_301660 [Rubroshorea leprosula]